MKPKLQAIQRVFHPGGPVGTPGVGQELVPECGHDNQETLNPHAHDDGERRDRGSGDRTEALDGQDGQGMMRLQKPADPEQWREMLANALQKTAILSGGLPYQVVSRSARVVEPEQAHGKEQLAEILEMDGLEIFL